MAPSLNNDQQKPAKKSGMTRQDAGRLGGQTTRKRYGSEHFSEIGRQGGKARGDHTEKTENDEPSAMKKQMSMSR